MSAQDVSFDINGVFAHFTMQTLTCSQGQNTRATAGRTMFGASAVLLAGALVALTCISARADGGRVVLSTGVGAAAGAMIGQAAGGYQGAVVGGALGAVVGASAAANGSYYSEGSYRLPPDRMYAQPVYQPTYQPHYPVVYAPMYRPVVRQHGYPVYYDRPYRLVEQPRHRHGGGGGQGWERDDRRHDRDHRGSYRRD